MPEAAFEFEGHKYDKNGHRWTKMQVTNRGGYVARIIGKYYINGQLVEENSGRFPGIQQITKK